MNEFMNVLSTKLAPKINKVNRNIWISVLKDSILQVLPFILVSSFITLLGLFSNIFKWWPDLSGISNFTFGIISIFVSFLIPFNMMEKKKLSKQRLISGLTSIGLFLLLTNPNLTKNGEAIFQFSFFGAGGMFVAILCGIFTAFVMERFGSFSFFSEDSVIPDFVTAWFDSMLPIGTVIASGWLFVDVLKIDVYKLIIQLFSPLGGIVETLPGFVLVMFIFCFIFSMGISTWVMTPITTPVFLAAIQANQMNGASKIVTSETLYSAYLWIGGVGCTMPLVLMMLFFAKSKRLKTLGKAFIVPSIFNINEPTVFGAIVWNPYLMVPMWLQGIILPIIVWVGLKSKLGQIPSSVFQLWYVPFPISTWLTGKTFGSIILVLLVFIVAAMIWYPFFKLYDRDLMEKEIEEVE
ncbi:PTS sugar transporter subunit IIC [Companilactobacillus halodurans]|uniref:Permease IIC component n=1 Tax=Companilactobacillus halodurans TaxID=2584183 RepID=A0A5P0ZQP9_9LACO|nr:PTS transporter subunit EIIC [Companilactobacillus halodurans]MQS76580.1 PTS sugar transporter subunit IIC [Companilactobacillus halodurans]MQS98216.1 PTS sugar transporter subunit IIC [Companilactobacillus halodurans]